jgi:hypothetical protein
MLRDDASDFICVSRDQANLSLETNAIATEKSPYSVLVWSFVIRVSSFEFFADTPQSIRGRLRRRGPRTGNAPRRRKRLHLRFSRSGESVVGNKYNCDRKIAIFRLGLVIGHSSFVIDSSFEFRHSNLSLLRRMAFEVACVVADRRPGMLRDDASDFICVSRDQANLSLAHSRKVI